NPRERQWKLPRLATAAASAFCRTRRVRCMERWTRLAMPGPIMRTTRRPDRLGVCARWQKRLGRSDDPLLSPSAPSVEAAAAEEQDNDNDKKDGCHIHGFL